MFESRSGRVNQNRQLACCCSSPSRCSPAEKMPGTQAYAYIEETHGNLVGCKPIHITNSSLEEAEIPKAHL